MFVEIIWGLAWCFSFLERVTFALSGRWHTYILVSLQCSFRDWDVSKLSRSPCEIQPVLFTFTPSIQLLTSTFPSQPSNAQLSAFPLEMANIPKKSSPKHRVHLPEPLTCPPPKTSKQIFILFFPRFSGSIHLEDYSDLLSLWLPEIRVLDVCILGRSLNQYSILEEI